MSIYFHNQKLKSGRKKLVIAASLSLIIFLAATSSVLLRHYKELSSAPQTTITSSAKTLTGYINPYFIFKDTDKWVQSKADSTNNRIVYYQYKDGVIAQQLTVFIDTNPSTIDLAANRVLPVRVVNGDGLSAGSLSPPCSSVSGDNQVGVKQVTISGASILCDVSTNGYSVVLAQQGSDYHLKLIKSKVPRNFIVVYRDYTDQPNTKSIINIANSFRAI
jgi:hypothetical protein